MFHPRPLPTRSICWKCRLRIANQSRGFARRTSPNGIAARAVSRLPRRALHASHITQRPPVADSDSFSTPSSPLDPSLLSGAASGKPDIRSQLAQWQTEFGGPDEVFLSTFGNHPAHGAVSNNMSKLSHTFKADEEHDMDVVVPEEDEDDSLITLGLFLKPGDVVELSQSGRESVLAVFVQQLEHDSQFFSVNGRWCHSRLTNITFAIRGCIDTALIEPLIPYMPTKPSGLDFKAPLHIPRELGAPVRAVLHQLTEEAEKIYRTNASVLDTAYSVLADPSRTRMMTLAHITKALLGKGDRSWTPAPSALLAVRKALNHNEFRFSSDSRSQRLTNVFAIRPKNDVEVVETVHEWIREYNDRSASATSDRKPRVVKSSGATYVAQFVDKACRLINISRWHRQPHPGGVGPDKTRFPLENQQSSLRPTMEEAFTVADQKIIGFLRAWVLTAQFSRMPVLHSACTSILHATGLYEDQYIRNTPDGGMLMGRETGHLFLQEIGVITPFENRAIYDEQLMLPTVRLSRNLEALNKKAEVTKKNPQFVDSMADLRRDWGSATVFCIDGADAKEIDDGISIERVKGTSSEFWIHVHVANPTAFLEKTHALSGLAAHMTETVYIPERVFPMLPKWATQNHFGLEAHRPVITFSSRVNASGTLLESKIQHGIIRKVVSMTPSEVSVSLGEPPKGIVSKLVVGDGSSIKSPKRSPPRLNPRQFQDLRDLYNVAKARWSVRKAAGAVRFDIAESSVQVYENARQPGLKWTPPSLDQARFIRGDPVIEVRSVKPNVLATEVNPENIVEEMMVLACTSAASWCTERDVPVMFRGTIEPPSQDLSLEQFQSLVVAPHLEKHGRLLPGLGSQYMQTMGRAIAHSSPLPHKPLGVSAYVKVTSPLRRFSDMIAHWQIEAAVRHEARHGKGTSRPVLPFSLRQVQESIITLSPREKIIGAAKRKAVHFWTVQAYHRAFNYREAPLPDSFNVWIQSPAVEGVNKPRTFGFTDSEGIEVTLIGKPGTFQRGDLWRVKMHSVDVWEQSITVTPLELLHREANLI